MLDNTQKEFIKIINQIAHRFDRRQVFHDFCQMAAISIANAVQFDQAREDQYLQITGKYNDKEIHEFPKLLGLVAAGLEGLESDFLGEIYMDLELSNNHQGQFFTPFALSELCADMALIDIEYSINKRGYFTMNDPACGSGGMIIALARSMRSKKLNYQSQLYVIAQDISSVAAYMAYIQLSLLYIPAEVRVENTLSLQTYDVFHTPAYILGLWKYRLHGNEKENTEETGEKDDRQEDAGEEESWQEENRASPAA